MKKIYFYAQDENLGSFQMRGHQVSSYLNLVKVESECITHTDVEDSIVIAVKHISTDAIRELRKKGNKIILDLVDLFCYKRYASQFISLTAVDGAITCTESVKEFFMPWMPNMVMTIPHHWDTRLMDKAEDTETFAIGYVGDKINHELKAVDNVVPVYHDWVDNAFKFKCHYSVRQPHSIAANFKPPTKVSTAAAVGANIITTRDAGVVELLGDDYPYYVDYDKKSINEMVKKVRLDWLEDTEDWKKGLDYMAVVRSKTSLPVCAEGYIKYAEALS